MQLQFMESQRGKLFLIIPTCIVGCECFQRKLKLSHGVILERLWFVLFVVSNLCIDIQSYRVEMEKRTETLKDYTKLLENLEKARERTREKKRERIQEYFKNPCRCLFCGKELDYEHRKNIFCSSTCSAKHNNGKRAPRTEESRKKVGEKIRKHLKNLSEKEKQEIK